MDKNNIFIIGGCATRDAFTLTDNGYNISGYIARSSFASSFAHTKFMFSLEELDSEKSMTSPFQMRMVNYDLLKQAEQQIRRTAPELGCIIVDFNMERLALLAAPDGSLATYSPELQKTKCLSRMREIKQLTADTEERFTLWQEGFDRFMALCQEVGVKVAVNRARWSDQAYDGTPTGNAKYIEANNKLLEKLWQYAERQGVSTFIDPPSSVILADPHHKWGLGPYHYVQDYYSFVIKRLDEVMG